MSPLPGKTLIHSTLFISSRQDANLSKGASGVDSSLWEYWNGINPSSLHNAASRTEWQRNTLDPDRVQVHVSPWATMSHRVTCHLGQVSEQEEQSKRLWLRQSRTLGRTVRGQAWRDPLSHSHSLEGLSGHSLCFTLSHSTGVWLQG